MHLEKQIYKRLKILHLKGERNWPKIYHDSVITNIRYVSLCIIMGLIVDKNTD